MSASGAEVVELIPASAAKLDDGFGESAADGEARVEVGEAGGHGEGLGADAKDFAAALDGAGASGGAEFGELA